MSSSTAGQQGQDLHELLRQMAKEDNDCLKPLLDGKETVLQALARNKEAQKKVALTTCDELIVTAPKDCLQLCTYMHERLPRELRDMVYEYTMNTVGLDQVDRTVFVQTLEYFEDAPDLEALISKHEKDGMVMTYAHGPSYGAQQYIWDEGFVGSEVRQELVQEWFWKSTFDFGPNIDLIDRFLSSDIFGAGCEAVGITRNIEIALGDSDLDGTISLDGLRCLTKIPKAARLRIDLGHCEKLFKKSEAQDRADFLHVLQTLWTYISDLEKWSIEFVIPSAIGAEQGYDAQNRELTLPGYDVDMIVPGIPGLPGKELTVDEWLAKYDEIRLQVGQHYHENVAEGSDDDDATYPSEDSEDYESSSDEDIDASMETEEASANRSTYGRLTSAHALANLTSL